MEENIANMVEIGTRKELKKKSLSVVRNGLVVLYWGRIFANIEIFKKVWLCKSLHHSRPERNLLQTS